MAVELVIKISEKIYNALTHTEFDANLVANEMRKSIVNGTPLPKGHGRLIDASNLITVTDYDGENEKTYVLYDEIDNAQTIIEADNKTIKTYCTKCPYFNDIIYEGEQWYGARCEKDGHSTNPSMYAIQSLNNDCPLTEDKEDK